MVIETRSMKAKNGARASRPPRDSRSGSAGRDSRSGSAGRGGVEAVVPRDNSNADANASASAGRNGADANANASGPPTLRQQNLRNFQEMERILQHFQQRVSANPNGGGVDAAQAEVAQITQEVAEIILNADNLGSGGRDNDPGRDAFQREANRILGQINSGAVTIDTAGVLTFIGMMTAELIEHRQQHDDLTKLVRLLQLLQQQQQLLLQQQQQHIQQLQQLQLQQEQEEQEEE